MSGKQAKILSIQQIEDLLVFAAQTRCPARNLVLVLLSVRAGLRAGEIANLTWEMVLDPTGAVGSIIELRDWAAKKNSGRTIPLHPDLVAALEPEHVEVRFLPFDWRLNATAGERIR
jgi:integrase/recombinase XerD